MALTEAKLQKLQDKKFDKLYDDNKENWDTLVDSAYDYASNNITTAPRPDDVAQVLVPIMEVNELLREHQDKYKARAKWWVEWFVEYAIDRRYSPSISRK